MSTPPSTRSRRRVLGSFYTPDWIARWMVARALSASDQPSAGDQSANDPSWRILDPACGDGAFVLPVLDAIAGHRGVAPHDVSGRLAIVREQVFGVDADRAAIDVLRRRVADWVGIAPLFRGEIADVLMKNFPCGDALLGSDWSGPPVATCAIGDVVPNAHDPDGQLRNVARTPRPCVSNPTRTDEASVPRLFPQTDELVRPIHWPTAFPEAAAAGGFDLVIGNPPYRRELNAKLDFDRIATSAIGQRWRTARMDLWHYFFHRSLDLLKPGGRLSFIVNSYWTGATAAKSLRERMAAETTIEELVLLGPARLFRDVTGRHMIFRVRKGRDAETRCNVLDLSNEPRELIEAAFSRGPSAAATTLTHVPAIRTVSQADLWSGGQLRVDVAEKNDPSLPHSPVLGEAFEVRQGMAENPPFVTKSAAVELGDPLLAGRGVFVLTADEVAALQLSEREHSLLRPYYALFTIGRFQVAPQPSHQILYLTRHTAPSLGDFPRVAAHLERFRPVLQRRREAQSGKIAWWHLHWPREERLFTAPRILCLQMGHTPRFAFAEHPTYVGFSAHVIVDRAASSDVPMPLAALTAVLNSSHAQRWFETHAKRRGAHLDISGTVLKQFPLPSPCCARVVTELEQLTRTWPATPAAEGRLNALVDELYAT